MQTLSPDALADTCGGGAFMQPKPDLIITDGNVTPGLLTGARGRAFDPWSFGVGLGLGVGLGR